MLEEITRLRKAIKDEEPKKRVAQFYEEYIESYKEIKQPKKSHLQEFNDLFFEYHNYMKKERAK